MATNKQQKTLDIASAKPPVDKIRIGLMTATIWERPSENSMFYSVTFERRYRDAKGEWHSSHSYDAADLLAFSKLADQAHSRIIELKNAKAAA